MHKLPDEIRNSLKDKYGFTDQDINCAQMTYVDWYAGSPRVAIPVRSRTLQIVGQNFRRLGEGEGPKSLIRMIQGVDNVPMSWYPFNFVKSNLKLPLIVVEDQFSAIKACLYMNSVALLGTNLSALKVNELLKSGYSHIVIALDKDATGKAADMLLMYKDLFPKLTILVLTKDIKDCSDKELEILFKDLL